MPISNAAFESVPAEQIDALRELISAPEEDISDDLLARAISDTSYLDSHGQTTLYDLYGAAHRALTYLAARYKVQFSFSVGQQRMELSQKHENCLSLAQHFLSMARIPSSDLVRTDTWF
jgi:hypothetical protein